jgi:hypothetical protein
VTHDPTDRIRAALEQARRMAEQAVQELLRRNPNASLDEINAALEARNREYNRRPQPELGGLSPEQMQRLISDDWSGDGVVRLNTSLPLEMLGDSPTLYNARLLLRMLVERSSVRATVAGNLPRSVVAEFRDRLRLPPDLPAEYLTGARNEEDVFPLHVVRVLLDLAGLIKRRKGAFSATRRGSDLLADERAGELFARLFETHFRTLNLGYLDRMLVDAPGFQHTIAYALYRFGRIDPGWASPATIAEAVVLDSVRMELPGSEYRDWAAAITEARLLRTLTRFGLAELRELPREGSLVGDREYRRTPLFEHFLSFALDSPRVSRR